MKISTICLIIDIIIVLTNCTNCGPRYSIIKQFLMIDENTSMKRVCIMQNAKKSMKIPQIEDIMHNQFLGTKFVDQILTLYTKNMEISNNLEVLKNSKLINEGYI